MEIFGYEFKNGALLERALTTPARKMDTPGAKDNQRLEFLGDAVLGLLSAEKVYHGFPNVQEGALTVKRTHMVSSPALCAAAVRHGLGARLRRNKGAAPLPDNAKTYADAVEAILGAAWLDGGLPAARQIFAALALSDVASAATGRLNPKGDLQIRAQAMTPPRRPVYTRVSVSGKVHDPLFTMRAEVEGLGAAEASARSRREAEARAAEKLLDALEGDAERTAVC
jgi:ribonuclease-3